MRKQWERTRVFMEISYKTLASPWKVKLAVKLSQTLGQRLTLEKCNPDFSSSMLLDTCIAQEHNESLRVLASAGSIDSVDIRSLMQRLLRGGSWR